MNAATDTHYDELRRSVSRFTQRKSSMARVRKMRGTRPGFEDEVWKDIAGQGWLGVTVPEADGGLGLGLPEAAILAEEFGRALMPEPLLAALSLGTSALVHSRNSALRSELLPAICAGERIASLAWQEAPNAVDPIPQLTRVVRTAGRRVLSGQKLFVWPAAGVAGFVVSAAGPEGVGLYWVAGDAPGIDYRLDERANGSAAAHLRLSDVVIDDAQVVVPPPHGQAVLRQTLDEATVLVCAELLGVMSRSLEISLAYLKTRSQFGRPIGTFQALQHRAVDLFIQQELSRAVVEETVRRLQAGPGEAERAAAVSRAKARCSDAAVRICREGIQMHGAIGFTDECDIGLYLKHAIVLSAWLGNSTVHRARFAAYSPPESVEEPDGRGQRGK